MSSVPLVGSAAASLAMPSVVRVTTASDGVQASAGVGAAKSERVSIQSIFDLAASSAKVVITDALFDTTTLPTRRKLVLFDKAADALGVRKESYASPTDYRAAIKDAFAKLKLEKDFSNVARAIEENLGLSKLGVSLETVIKAALYPNGDEDRALTSALTIHDRLHPPARPSGSGIPTLSLDTLGLYRVAR